MIKYILLTEFILIFMSCHKDDVGLTSPVKNLPTLTTNEPSKLTYFSVILSGKLLDSAGAKISEIGIVADTVSMPTASKNFQKFKNILRQDDGYFKVTVTHLVSNTTFYLRAYATNTFGTGYGDEVTLTTLTEKIFEGDANLTTQQQVTDFGAQHYTTINGDLNINETVSDLTPLLGLTIVNNSFYATNSLLTNFKGLDSLEITGAVNSGHFWIEQNKSLINFSGLSKLKYASGSFQVYHNVNLLNLDGLDSYYACNSGELYIGFNDKLQNLNGLSHLVFIGDFFELVKNPSLTDINGLSNLTTVHGNIYISDNSSLSDFCPLKKLFSSGFSDYFTATNNAANPKLNDVLTNCN